MRRTVRTLVVFCLLFFVSGKAIYSQPQADNGQPAANPAAAEAGRPSGEPVEICLAPASVQMAAGKSDDAVQAVRDAFVTFLNGPNLKVIPLTSRLASQAREEAKQGHCRYVLFVTLTHKKKSGGGGLFTRAASDAAGSAVWHIPGGGSTGSAAARSAATSVVSTALRGVATNVKAQRRDDARISSGGCRSHGSPAGEI